MNPSTRKILIWSGVFATLIAAGGGGYLYFKRNIALAMNYCYKLVGVKNFSLTKDKLKVTILVRILNRSEIAANLVGYSLDISVNDIRIGKVSSDKKQSIAANTGSTMEVGVDISSVGKFTAIDIANIALNYLNKKNWDKIVFGIKGSLKASVKVLGVEVAVPIPLDIKMSLKEMMEDDPNSTAKMECPKSF